jgi:hypothetical protein
MKMNVGVKVETLSAPRISRIILDVAGSINDVLNVLMMAIVRSIKSIVRGIRDALNVK